MPEVGPNRSDATHDAQVRMGKDGGLVRVAPHLVPENAWYDMHGWSVRNKRIAQVGPWKQAVLFSYIEAVRGVATVPINVDRTLLLLMGDTHVTYLPAGATTGQVTVASGLNSASSFARWCWMAMESEAYFADPYNTLKHLSNVSGSLAVTEAISDPLYRYTAKYMVLYHNHLVLANVGVAGSPFPLRVAYSDIDNLSDFTPTDVNDADFYDIEETQASLFGITGMSKMMDNVLIYTRDDIWRMTYVGFNNGVMNFARVGAGIGCAFPYSLICFKNFHYFIGDDNFYTYNGYWVQPIGDSVRDYFFGTSGPTTDQFQKTIGFRDRFTGELCWSFPDPNTSRQTILAYNPVANTWSKYESPTPFYDYVSAGQGAYTPIYMLAGHTITSYTGHTIASLSNFSVVQQPLVATTNGLFAQWPGTTTLATGATANGVLAEPYLETGDVFYNDISSIKELDTLFLDATYDSTTCRGVEVFISVRNQVEAPVTWRSLGLWTPNLRTTNLGAPRLSGRIVRFKFVWRLESGNNFQQVSGARVSGFAEDLLKYDQEN